MGTRRRTVTNAKSVVTFMKKLSVEKKRRNVNLAHIVCYSMSRNQSYPAMWKLIVGIRVGIGNGRHKKGRS